MGLSMAARTINRKRSDECLSFNGSYSSCLSSTDSRAFKRPRLSSTNQRLSRVSLYPDMKTPITREVHAPFKTRKFDLSPRDWRPETDDSTAIYVSKYFKAKNSALGAFRYLENSKEVVEVDSEDEKNEDSEDSSVQVVEVVDDGRENDGAGDGMWEFDAKVHQMQSSSSLASELTNGGLKGDNAGKIVDSLSVKRDFSDISVYKKLLEIVEKRTATLTRLNFEIQLHEKRRSDLSFLHPKKKHKEEKLREPFLPLTQEEEAEVDDALTASSKNKVLVSHENSGIQITGGVLQCLRPATWLNDEVINLYLEFLKEREKREPQKFLKCHFFNTFFYKKLISGRNGYDFKSVRRWTSQRKLGYSLIECDKIFVPIHKEIHWCLGVINQKDKKFQYLDSLKGKDTKVPQVLAKYFVDEVKDKNGKNIDLSSWEQEFVEDLPEQKNGYDCGMFMIKYADFYSRGLDLSFDQGHMPYFRLRTAKEILRLRAD